MALYTNANVQNVILTVLALVVLLMIVWCVYTFIRAIILFLFAHGKEENKKKWRNSIRFMIIGIVLSILLLVLVPVVLKWMKVPEYDTYKAKNIFVRAGELTSWLFNLGNIIQQSQQNSEYRGEFYQDVTPWVDTNTVQPITTDQYNL